MRPLLGALLVAAAAATAAGVTREDVLKTDTVRVERLILDAGGSTGQHTHTLPHISVSLTDGTLTDIAPDGTEQPRARKEGSLAWVPSGVSHALRNDGGAVFRAVTLNFLQPQTGARNRCGALLQDQPTDCPKPAKKSKGATLVPQMETDQALVSLLTLDPGAEYPFKAGRTAPVVAALAGTEAKALVSLKIAGAVGRGEKPLAGGDAASTFPNAPMTIRNTGTMPARFVVLEFK